MGVRFFVGRAVISLLMGCQVPAPKTAAFETNTGVAASVKEQGTAASGVSNAQTQTPSEANVVESTSIIPRGFWRVVKINNARLESPAKFNFGTRGVTGEGPCNLFSADWSKGPRGLNFGSVATTRRACAPNAMAEEGKFVRILEEVTRTYMQDGTLIMMTPDDESLVMLPR